MPDRLAVAIVGTGIGREHLAGFKALPDLYDVAAVCDIDRNRAEALAAAFGVRRVETRLDALLGDPAIDVIDLCTPAHLHVRQIQAVLAAGQHVICEKPLAGSLAEVDRIAAMAASANGRLMPIFQRRFGGGVRKLRHLVDLGLTGRAYIATVETHWQRGPDYYEVAWRGRWATELGGVNLTQAIHAHDLLTHVLGPIARVYAATRTAVNPIEVEDCSAAVVEMADGSVATLSATLGAARQTSRLKFVFQNVTVESHADAYGFDTDPWQFIATTPERQSAIDVALRGAEPGHEGFAGQFASFHAALAGNADPPVTVGDARRSLELVTAIYHSARQGQPVDLPIGEEHPCYRGWLSPPG
ncbi:MAG: Gfo/Idh/MocA family protein [Inquilinaceae bacterium]